MTVSRQQGPQAEGVLLVDKPAGPTSHDVIARVRRTLGQRRVGHTGTLDPFASGLLVICVGGATRLAEYLTGLDKEYRATMRLGQSTATHDSEAAVGEERSGWEGLDGARLEEALLSFRGTILQRPPRFSAKKVGGEAAHRRMRRGEEVRLEPVAVTVHEIELDSMLLPDVEIRLRCSSGTYVRALARDVGEHLGVGAHLTALRRTSVGRFKVDDAVAPSALDEREALLGALIEPAPAMAHLPAVELGAEEAARLGHGQAIPWPLGSPGEDETSVALHLGSLVAVVIRRGESLRPLKVFQGGEG